MARALSIEARILAMLPSRSPTVGLIWARPMRRSRMDRSVCDACSGRASRASAAVRARRQPAREPHARGVRGREAYMKRVTSLVALVAVAALTTCGCAAKEAKWSGNAAAMVVYAKSIPLYPGARAKDVMGSDSWGDTPESHSEGMAVWFEVKDYDREKVLAWYRERLPGAITHPLETGTIELTVPAPNGEPGETMGVAVGAEDFRVFESTKPGKHKKT